MARARRPWKVGPHGPIERIEENLWAVSGLIPGTSASRRMMIVRRSDGELLFYNALPLDDRTLGEVKDWGRPAILVVPHHAHCIDAHGFREQLGVAVYGPRACAAQVRARVELEGHIEDLPPDPALRFETVEGVDHGEPVLFLTSPGGQLSLIFADVFQNHVQDKTKLLYRLLGFSGARTPPLYKLLHVQDRAALRAQLERWATAPRLSRLVPSHGEIIDHDAPAVLRSAAAQL